MAAGVSVLYLAASIKRMLDVYISGCYLPNKDIIQTINGATASAGRRFPTRIFLISSRLLIASPIKITPPAAVISFIIAGVASVFNCAASRLMPP